MTRVEYFLEAKYDSCKSFYKKAKVVSREDGTILLQSYKSVICILHKDKTLDVVAKDYELTRTTVRHLKEFLKQNGFEYKKGQTRYELH